MTYEEAYWQVRHKYRHWDGRNWRIIKHGPDKLNSLFGKGACRAEFRIPDPPPRKPVKYHQDISPDQLLPDGFSLPWLAADEDQNI